MPMTPIWKDYPFVVMYPGGGIGAVRGYTMVNKALAPRSQKIVFMEPWTFEQKRNFLVSALKP